MQTRMSVYATVFAVAMVAGSTAARAQYAPIGGMLGNNPHQTGANSSGQGNTNRNQPTGGWNRTNNASPTQPANGGWNRSTNVSGGQQSSGGYNQSRNSSQPTSGGRSWDTQANHAMGTQGGGQGQTRSFSQQNNQALQQRGQSQLIRPGSGFGGGSNALVQSSGRPQTTSTQSQGYKPTAAPPHRNR